MDVPCDEDTVTSTYPKKTWIFLLRQMFISSGVTSYFLIYGLFFGAPTVYVPQIQKEANSSEIISMDTVSWLFSISNYGSLLWAIIIPLIAERFGRKIPFIVSWVTTIICVMLFYFSTSVTELLVCGFLQGTLPSLLTIMSITILTEYTSPKYRGIFITFKGATFYWGVWISNAIGTYSHWKNIGILIFVCSIYSITIIFWPESSYWLASKGRFEESARSHRWLKGSDIESEKELKKLIISQREIIKQDQERSNENKKNWISKVFITMKAKCFYKPLMFSVLTMCLYHFSGKMACTGYVLDIIKKITSSSSAAYEGMLVLDGVTVFGMYIGVFLTRFLNRRTLLLGAASTGVTFLLILSLYLFLVHFRVLSENKFLTLFLLTGFSVTISCGPMIMSMCFCSELTPLQGRCLFLCIFTLVINIIMGSTLKAFPYIFKYFGAPGTFLFQAILSSILIFILYKVLPETKNKTIQEIEKCLANNDDALNKEITLTNIDSGCDANLKSLLRN